MTRNAPASREGFRPDDYSSRHCEISKENQSTHSAFIIHLNPFPLQHHRHTSLLHTSVLSLLSILPVTLSLYHSFVMEDLLPFPKVPRRVF